MYAVCDVLTLLFCDTANKECCGHRHGELGKPVHHRIIQPFVVDGSSPSLSFAQFYALSPPRVLQALSLPSASLPSILIHFYSVNATTLTLNN